MPSEMSEGGGSDASGLEMFLMTLLRLKKLNCNKQSKS